MKFRKFLFFFLTASLLSGLATAAVTVRSSSRTAPVPDQAVPTLAASPAALSFASETAPETTAATEAATVPTTVPATEPAPTGLPAPAGDLDTKISLNKKSNPRLDWAPVPNAASYEIWRSLYPDRGFNVISATAETHYVNASAARGLTHYFQVCALDADGSVLSTSQIQNIELPFNKWESQSPQYVAIPKIKLHTLPDSESPEISLRYMDEVRLGAAVITRDTGIWYRCYYNDQLYYLLMKPDARDLTTAKSYFRYNPQTELQKQVLDLALDICQNQKTAYVPGGSGSVNAEGTYEFDCSGLVTYILNTVMQRHVPTYRLSASMSKLALTDHIYNAGYAGELRAQDVALEDIRPGDVLFFRSQLDLVPSEELGHCSIYLGNNEFIHCTSVWEDSVCIMPLAGDFRDNLLSIRRFLPDRATPANAKQVINGPYKSYKIYADKNSASAVVAAPAQGDTLTILFTNNDNWAYVRTAEGITGYFLLQNFGDAAFQS